MLNKKARQEMLGGIVKDEGQYCHCVYNGFYLKIRPNTAGRYDLTIPVYSEADPGNGNVIGWLQQLMSVSPDLITAVNADRFGFTVTYKAGTMNALTANTGALADRITGFLRESGYRPCCENCGLPREDLSCWEVNGKPFIFCETCASGVGQSLQEEQVRKESVNSNLALGLIGAFLGAMAGSLGWILLNRLGFIAGIAGYFIAFLAFKGYEKLGKSLDKKGAITCLLVTVVTIYLANKLCWSWDAYSALKDYGYSFGQCFGELGYILKQSDLMGSYILDLVIGLALTALSSFRAFASVFNSVTGKYSIVKK